MTAERSQNGCQDLPPEEPCQPVDIRLAVSRDPGVGFARQNATPPAGAGRCVGMCDPEARRALVGVGMAGSWMSRSVWANPYPIRPGDPALGAHKRPQRFPQYIGFVWHFCMGAPGA